MQSDAQWELKDELNMLNKNDIKNRYVLIYPLWLKVM